MAVIPSEPGSESRNRELYWQSDACRTRLIANCLGLRPCGAFASGMSKAVRSVIRHMPLGMYSRRSSSQPNDADIARPFADHVVLPVNRTRGRQHAILRRQLVAVCVQAALLQ